MDPNSLHQLAEGAGRVGLALLLGAALGTNRALIGKSAGPRTFAMVTLGAALVTWLGASMMVVEHDLSAPSRIIQGLLTGTGFLGGGLILRAL